PLVVDRFLKFHIENKELSAVIVRRSMKIYIEQFDPDKSYLLEQEVEPYLNMSERRANEILARLKQHDYSDFIALNQVIQQAILRSEKMRERLAEQMSLLDEGREGMILVAPSRFARKESELLIRQKMRMM